MQLKKESIPDEFFKKVKEDKIKYFFNENGYGVEKYGTARHVIHYYIIRHVNFAC
jgi:hypothetical protein